MTDTKKHLYLRQICVWLAAVCSFTVTSRGQDRRAAVQIGADGKINLRILCTTSPKAGRTDDFVKFLSEHFVKVATTDYESFDASAAEGFDVVIIDYGTTRPGSPLPRRLSPGYSRATVTMGVAGSEVGRRLGLKTGYL